MSRGIERALRYSEKAEAPDPTFESIGIIGASGQTGRLYMERITSTFPEMPITAIDVRGKKISFPDSVTSSTDIAAVLSQEKPPQAIILATPNPTDGLLKTIGDNLGDNFPLTLILPQNGVEVVGIAQRVFKNNPVTLIRASLFSPVSNQENGSIKYNSNKLRIGLSLVPDAPNTVFDTNKAAVLQKTETLFRAGGFDARVFDTFESMEWTKLILNAVGASGAVTGYTPEQTFGDSTLRVLEMKAISDRLQILKAAGIKYADIPWGGANHLPLLDKLVIRGFRNHQPLSAFIKKLIVSGRENKPSGAWLSIKAEKPTEVVYYHQPFIELARQYGLRSIVDEAILEVVRMHKVGETDLTTKTPNDRRQLLLDIYTDFVRKSAKTRAQL